jgi:GTP-binding protein
MTQTKFVLKKALARNLTPIVVMNKIDRETAQPEKVENDLLELFIGLDASDSSLDYPILYASAKNGYASTDKSAREGTVLPLLDTMIDTVPPPKNDPTKPFSMIITQIENDSYVGYKNNKLEKCTWEKFILGLFVWAMQLGQLIHKEISVVMRNAPK